MYLEYLEYFFRDLGVLKKLFRVGCMLNQLYYNDYELLFVEGKFIKKGSEIF